MVDAVLPRFGWIGGEVDLDTYLAMARGVQEKEIDGRTRAGAAAMEMSRWFDTNHHYIVPEFHDGQRFALSSTKPVNEFLEAKALGIHARPVLLGPISLLLLSKAPTYRPRRRFPWMSEAIDLKKDREMWVEPMDREERDLATRGEFALVALGPANRPVAVPALE